MTADPSDLNVKRSALNVERSGAAGSRSESTAVDSANPWLGLASFTEETRAFFHGRDEEVAELGRRVQRKLLTILFGQSGLGKTSILRAGIVPRLRPEGYCPVYVRLDYGKDSPSPSEQIKQAIFRATKEAGDWTQSGSARAGESLWEFLHHRDDVLRDRTGRTLIPLLIFDQFEEIFTLAQGDDFGRQRAAQFLEDLADLVENRAPRALEARLEADEAGMERFDFARADYRILIALREDYLAHLEGLKQAMPSVTQNRMRLARMTGAQALAAVTRPGGGLVSEEVARQIVAFVSGAAELANAEVEPSLLSLVCRELNETRRAKGHTEISADLLAGSRDTILTEFYERTLADQPAGVRAFIEDELLTDSGYRESIAEERVKKGFAAAGAPAESLATLIDRRLLRVEERLDVRRVELTHDVLVGVVKASRDVRHERESKAAIERQLAETQAKEAAGRRALGRARLVAFACAVLAVGALGSAIFGYMNLQRARVSESAAHDAAEEAKRAGALADAARVQAEDLLGFVVSDLEEQLTAFGQLPILLRVTQKAVAYYEGMPEGMRTPSTRAAYARALANFGTVLDVQGDSKGSRARFEQSLAIYAQLEKEGALPLPVRLGYATAQRRMARLLSAGEGAMSEAVKMTESAERNLAPVLADAELAGLATAELAEILDQRAFALMRQGKPRDAVPVYQRGVQAANDADRMTGRLRPGLVGARLTGWMSEALGRSNRAAEAIAANERARAVLSEFVRKEPFLVSAMRQLATVYSGTIQVAAGKFDFKAAKAAQQEQIALYQQLLALDPKNTTYRNNGALATIATADLLNDEGEFAEYVRIEVALADKLSGPEATNFEKGNAAGGYSRAAAALADIGRDAEADAYLARAAALVKEIVAALPSDSADRMLNEELWRGRLRWTTMARLDWATVRREAEQALVKLGRDTAVPADDDRKRNIEQTAYRQIMIAAWATGDSPAARRAMERWWAQRDLPQENSLPSARLDEVGAQLQRAEILWQAGEAAEVRAILAKEEPELAALAPLAPDTKFMQMTQAQWFWLKARAEDTTTMEKRRLLAQALDIMNRFYNENRLTKFESEILRPRIRDDLRAVGG